MRVKYALKSVKSNKAFSLVLILQLICIFIAMYNIIDYSNTINYLSEKVEKIYANRSIYRFGYDEESFFTINNQDEGLKLIKELSDSEEYIFTIAAPTEIPVILFDGYRQFIYQNCPIIETQDKQRYTYINSFSVNKNALDAYNVELESGRYFKESEYEQLEEGVLPIILGHDYKDIFKVGDIIEYVMINDIYKAKVVGILKEDETIPIKFDNNNVEANGNVDSNNYNLNGIMLIPYGENTIMNKLNISNVFWYNFVLLDSSLEDKRKDSILNEIEDKIENTIDSKFNRKSYDKEITLELDKYKELKANYSLTAIVAIVFSAITMIVSMLNSIKKRKREFGIYISCGATMKDIIGIIFFQMIAMVVIAIISTIIILKIYFLYFEIDSFYLVFDSVQFRTINYKIIGLMLLFGVFYSSITSIIPLRKLSKLDIHELLRKDD